MPQTEKKTGDDIEVTDKGLEDLDVSLESEIEPTERDLAMDKIVAATIVERADEMGLKVEDLEVADPDEEPGGELEADLEVADPEAAAAAVKEKEALAAAEPGTIEIIVDGEAKTVPLSDIMDAGKRTLQKESTADKRLADATELLKGAQSRVAADPAIRRTTDAEIDENARMAELEEVDETKVAGLVQKIQYGSEEDAQGALKEVIRLGRSGSASEDQVLARVQGRMDMIDIQSRFDAVPEIKDGKVVGGGYGDLIKDPYLRQMAAAKVDELVAAGEGTYKDFETYQKAGDFVRKWRDDLSGATTTTHESPTLEEKKGKKRQKDTIQSAGTGTQEADAETDKTDHEKTLADSRSGTIADMKKQRELST